MNVRVNRAVSVLLLLALLGPATSALARPRPETKHAAPADSSSARGRQTTRPGLASIQLSRSERVRSLLQQAGLTAAPSARTAPPTPAPRPKRERQSGQDEAAAGTDHSDAAPTSPDATQSGVDVFVPGPVTDAVARVCGDVTVCGVWWPTALGDRDAYKTCMLHRSAAADGLEFGTSPEEYCSALYNGDCDAPGQPDLAELCSLVPGVAAQWTPDYTFSRITTSGDCRLYKTVAIEEKRVLGLRLEPPLQPAPPGRAGGDQQLSICTGRLYLRIAH